MTLYFRPFFVALIFSLSQVLAAPPSIDENRVALVIGVDDYPEESEFPDLKNAIFDAKLVATSLESVGFGVALIKNPSRSELEDAVIAFGQEIKEGDTAVTYFSGHGIELDGQNYLMTSNARFKARSMLSEESLQAETLGSAMVLAGAESSFLLLDCCREIPADAEWATKGLKRYGLAEIQISGDIMIGLAAAPGKPAFEPREAGFNGPYATALAKWIPTGVNHLELFQKIRQEVNVITEGQQRTWENGSFLKPFYFAEGAAVPGRESPVDTAEMIALREHIVKLKATIEELRKTGKESVGLEQQLEKMEDTVDTGVQEEQKPIRSIFADPALAKLLKSMRENPNTSLPSASSRTEISAGGHSAALKKMVGSKAGETRTIGGIDMVWCPPTDESGFLMGSAESELDRGDDETLHRVKLTSGFWAAKTECTQSQWEKIVGTNPSSLSIASAPVDQLTWNDCQRWLAKMNKQHPLPDGWVWGLPSEAQWEYACRAGTNTVFSHGNSLTLDDAHFDGVPYGNGSMIFSLRFLKEVGEFQANRWGLHDMHGNVYEWCSDWYGKNYYSEGQIDPLGPKEGTYRVFRGGCAKSGAPSCRSANRPDREPDYKKDQIGFRPVVIPGLVSD